LKFLFMGRESQGRPPADEEEQYQATYPGGSGHAEGLPVTIRTVDIGSGLSQLDRSTDHRMDKARNYPPQPGAGARLRIRWNLADRRCSDPAADHRTGGLRRGQINLLVYAGTPESDSILLLDRARAQPTTRASPRPGATRRVVEIPFALHAQAVPEVLISCPSG
jgi:hypothetical protein